MALRRCYWYHVPTGRVWATEIDQDRVVAACGPLPYEQADVALLEYLPYRTDDAVVFCEAPHEFIFYAPRDSGLRAAAERVRETSVRLMKNARHLRDAAEVALIRIDIERTRAQRAS